MSSAWFQFSVNPIMPNISPSSHNGVIIGNILLIVAFFLSATFFTGYLLRMLARKYSIAVLIISVPIVALVNFITIFIIYLTPPRTLSRELFTSAHDLIFYASAAIFLAFFARAVLVNLLEPEKSSKTEKEDTEGIGTFIFGLLILAIWGNFVFAGQKMLTKTFLPEIAQPIEKVITKKTE